MKFKDLLFVALLAFCVNWALDYLVFSRWRTATVEQTTAQSGEQFVAPAHDHQAPQRKEIRPLNTEIDFVENEQASEESAAAPTELRRDEQTTDIETNWCVARFSTHGAALEKLDEKRCIEGKQCLITTIQPSEGNSREDAPFIVGLPERTPFYYELVESVARVDATQLVYRANSEYGAITKIFTIHHDKPQIDLAISGDQEIPSCRIFVPAPHIQTLIDDTISAVMNTAKNTVEKTASNKINFQNGWFSPTLFGTENKYFVHALVAAKCENSNQCIDRGYYKTAADGLLTSIIESYVIPAGSSYTTSWYMGPKEEKAMATVDPRLEGLLDYSGWLAPLSRLLLYLLDLIYQYVHNYGFAIIILTVFMRLLIVPFGVNSEEAAVKRAKMQQKMKHIKQKYKNDEQALAREQMALMKEDNPLGSCLPMLVQIPFFFALNRVLSSSIHLYQAPFIGWIKDLSAKDPLYVIPVLTSIAMIVHAMYVPASQRLPMMLMAIFVGALTSGWASGLTLFFLVSTLFGVLQFIIQQWISKRRSNNNKRAYRV